MGFWPSAVPGPRIHLRPQAAAQRPLSPSFNLKGLSSGYPPYRSASCGVINPLQCEVHTLETLEELGLDTHTVTKLALKLHAHSVQDACKLASIRRAPEEANLNSHNQDRGLLLRKTVLENKYMVAKRLKTPIHRPCQPTSISPCESIPHIN
eukprot:514495-Pelagomonas_calceolata.AAC.4